MYGRSYLIEGENYGKAIEMFEEAARRYPSSVAIRVWLAEAYMRDGRDESAIQAARLVLAWGHSDNGPARIARSIIDRLEDHDAEPGVPSESSNP